MPAIQERDIQTLHKSALFQGIDRALLLEVVKAGRWRFLEEGIKLFDQGDTAEHIHILTQGKVKLSQITPEGNQIVLRILGPSHVIGGVAVIENFPYPATSTLLERSLVFSLPKEELLEFMREEGQIGINVMKLLLHRVREFQDRFKEIATQRVEPRLCKALLRLAKQVGKQMPEGVLIDLALSRQDLAEITGTTLYTVSRVLTQWEKSGWIKSTRKKILLCDPLKLEQEFMDATF